MESEHPDDNVAQQVPLDGTKNPVESNAATPVHSDTESNSGDEADDANTSGTDSKNRPDPPLEEQDIAGLVQDVSESNVFTQSELRDVAWMLNELPSEEDRQKYACRILWDKFGVWETDGNERIQGLKDFLKARGLDTSAGDQEGPNVENAFDVSSDFFLQGFTNGASTADQDLRGPSQAPKATSGFNWSRFSEGAKSAAEAAYTRFIKGFYAKKDASSASWAETCWNTAKQAGTAAMIGVGILARAVSLALQGTAAFVLTESKKAKEQWEAAWSTQQEQDTKEPEWDDSEQNRGRSRSRSARSAESGSFSHIGSPDRDVMASAG